MDDPAPGVSAALPQANWDRFAREAEALAVELTAAQLASLRRYLELLCEWNRRMNLTAIERPEEILEKHFLDSLTCARAADFSRQRTLIDVGTGAGFPGLVLKIAFPHLEVTLLDAVTKRLRFLERVSEELALSGVRTVHGRAEDAAHDRLHTTAVTAGAAEGPPLSEGGAPLRLREAFDVVTARAVARLNVLAEWTLPFASVGGCLIAMKGPAAAPEVDEARHALQTLGGGAPAVCELVLPQTGSGRTLVMVPKHRPTPRLYPRPPGQAKKSPL